MQEVNTTESNEINETVPVIENESDNQSVNEDAPVEQEEEISKETHNFIQPNDDLYECKTMTLEHQQAIAKQNGWDRLGEKYLSIENPIAVTDKLEASDELSEKMLKINELKEDKRAYDKGITSKIDALQDEAISLAEKIQGGVVVNERRVPCFLDPVTEERVYIDPSSLQELHREDAAEEDLQRKLFLTHANTDSVECFLVTKKETTDTGKEYNGELKRMTADQLIEEANEVLGKDKDQIVKTIDAVNFLRLNGFEVEAELPASEEAELEVQEEPGEDQAIEQSPEEASALNSHF